MKSSRASVLISGKVQGVGYRYWTVQTAKALGLKGWVRNKPDGRVEAVFQGSTEQVEQMIQLCHQGPVAAIVSDVTVEMGEPESYAGFQVIS
ncbi:acylphosphatase [Gloeothece verrucosa]|uniref:acylphosphatase n=1 Tax=Gloeothece verrucosa (strain PCC 7822) TaxID=497965 RepID=E0UEU9_GLOV7|nr:acylphosphatase [Gloeothece verrucosa]ADN13079.1 acylphosphatase [Gloeothece verrucosa PCC 7822]